MSALTGTLDFLLNAAEKTAAVNGYTGLSRALQAVGYATGEAEALAQDNPVEALAALVAGAAVVTVFAPELIAATAADLAGSSAMALVADGIEAFAASSIGGGLDASAAQLLAANCINVASSLIVETAAGAAVGDAVEDLVETSGSLVAEIGGNQTSLPVDDSSYPMITAAEVGADNASLIVPGSEATASTSLLITVPSGSGNGQIIIGVGQGQSIILENGSWSQINVNQPTSNSVIADVVDDNGTSQIITFQNDGLTVDTTYSGSNGTGAVTAIDQENADGTSQLTTYGTDGSSTQTTYSGPNGTGSITEVVNRSYQVSTISEPNSGGRTFLEGINDSDGVVGRPGGGQAYAFSYNLGSFSNIIYSQNETKSYVGYAGLSINNDDIIVGTYGFVSRDVGFIDDNDTITTVEFPNASYTRTFLLGISDSGAIVGTADDADIGGTLNVGFVYDDGSFNTISVPGSSSTSPSAISESGIIVGTYFASGNEGAFIDNSGTFTEFNISSSIDYMITGVNDSGVVVGDINYYGEGFIWDSGKYTTFKIPGAGLTDITGINDSGDLVGYYENSQGIYGFVADPQITDIVACYTAGTLILTPRGERPVEDLVAGDVVITNSGHKPSIKWIGKRHLDLSRHPHPEKAQPIRFEADCFADDVPTRDLFLSPDHALYIDGILVPAKALINGENIRQLAVPTVTYYHIELDEHSVIFAENTPAETYLETGNRGAFENCTDAMTLHPDFAQTEREAKGCAPFMESGTQVEAIRKRILERANIQTTDDPALTVQYRDGSAIIQSRHAIPGLITPDPRDRRRLGVKVANIIVDGRHISFDHPALIEGWHDCEPDGRWTDGSAVIPAELLAGANDVSVILAATLPYPVAV